MAEIDERYKRGMIYTIRNIKDDTMIYVGSTINNLSKRFYKHKKACKGGISCITLYSHIVDNDWSDFYIELYEMYPCNNKKELERREGQVIREIGSINKKIEGRSDKEYREENADKIKKWREENADKIKKQRREYYEKNINNILEKRKKYRDENADIVKEKKEEKVCCNICGAFSLKSNLARHQKSKKCMSKIPDNTDIPTDIHI